MSSVDDRIVNMQWNSKDFESGATSSQKSLLTMETALQNVAKSGAFAQIGQQVQRTTHGINVMRVAAYTAIGTIAHRITNSAINFVKSFTIDPIMGGIREYQTNLNSIQTIIANTGAKMPKVNHALNQLNHYSDQTIYNFGQMADAIGKFTSAGVNLKTSVASIKGMANLAALSGSNVQQMNTAMYQMSQALAAGTIRLQDWNSVVNAGMGGKNLQNSLKITARALGSNVDAMIKKTGSFRESLHEGWLTTKVFTNTMKAFSQGINIPVMKAQLQLQNKSNSEIKKAVDLAKQRQMAQLKGMGITGKEARQMADMANRAAESANTVKTLPQLLDTTKEAVGSIISKSMSGIVGNFKQSKKLWTAANVEISAVLNKMGTHIQKTLKAWRNAGGRTYVIEGFKNAFTALGKVVSVFGKAFKDVFSGPAFATMTKMSYGFQQLTAHLVPSKDTLKDFRAIFGGIFSLIHIYLTITSALRHLVIAFFEAFFQGSGNATGNVLGLVAALGKAITWFDKWLADTANLVKLFTRIGLVAGDTLHPIFVILQLIGEAIGDIFSGKGFDAALKPLSKIAFMLETLKEGLVSAFGQMYDAIQKTFGNIDTPFGKLGVVMDKVVAKLKTLAQAFKGSDLYAAGANIIAGLGQGIEANFGKVKASVEQLGQNVIDWIKNKLGIHSPASTMIPIGVNIIKGIVNGLLQGLSILISGIVKIVDAIFAGIAKVIAGTGNNNALNIASLLNALFAGGFLLAIKRLSDSLRHITDGLGGGLAETFEGLTKTLKAMQQQLKAAALRSLAVAIALLVASIIALQFINPSKTAIGVGAIGSLIAMMVGAFAAMNKIGGTVGENGKGIKGITAASAKLTAMASSMVAVAGAILILTAAVTILAHQDPKKVAVGIGFMSATLGIMVGAVFAFSKMGPLAKGASGAMVLMALAINMLMGVITALGLLPLKVLAKGIGAIAVALAIMTAALFALGLLDEKRLLAAGAAMVLVAGALNTLAFSIAFLGHLKLSTLAKGLGTLAIGLGLMVIALMVLSKGGPFVMEAAGALGVLSAALLGFAIAVRILGRMSLGDLAKGIGAFAVGLGLLLLAAAGAEFVAPGLEALGVAALMLGGGLALAGIGMAAFSAGLAVLVALGGAGLAAMTAAIGVFIGMLPQIAIQVAAAFVAFVQTIAAMSGQLRTAFDKIIKNMIGALVDNIGEMQKAFGELIRGGLQEIDKNIGPMTKTLRKLINAGFDVLGEYVDDAVKFGQGVVLAIIAGIHDIAPRIVRDILDLVGDMADAFTDGFHRLRTRLAHDADQLGYDMTAFGPSIIAGLVRGISRASMDGIRNAIGAVANIIPSWARHVLHISSPSKVMMEIGGHVVSGLAHGIRNAAGELKDAAIDMAKKILAEGGKIVKDGVVMAAHAGEAVVKTGKNALQGAGHAAGHILSGLFGRSAIDSKDINRTARQYAFIGSTWAKALTNAMTKGIKLGTMKMKKSMFTTVIDQIHDGVQTTADRIKQTFIDLFDYLAKAGAQGHYGDKNQGIAKQSRRAVSTQQTSDVAAAREKILAKEAKKADKLAQKKGATKAQKQAAEAADHAANQAHRQAERAKKAADREAKKLAQQIQIQNYKDAGDFQSLGDLYSGKADSLAKQAAKMLAKANAEAAHAKDLTGKARKAMLNQAKDDAKKATELATAAANANENATSNYQKALKQRIDDYKDTYQFDLNYDKADTGGKLKMLQDRENKEKAAAAKAQKKAADYFSKAQKYKDTDAKASAHFLDLAEAAAQKAKDMSDAAKQDEDTANQLLGSVGNDASTIEPTHSVLMDAAKSVDSFTQSMLAAQAAAMVDNQPTQFVQNNYSPEALSTSEVYRQTNNLISLADLNRPK